MPPLRRVTMNQRSASASLCLGLAKDFMVREANHNRTSDKAQGNLPVHTHEPLRVSLEDLRQADSKGKWWLVGAAWGGDPLVEHQQEAHNEPTPDAPSENTLLKLAKKQGMNTDIRRSIFVVLMSSEVRPIFSQMRARTLTGSSLGLRRRLRTPHTTQTDRSSTARDRPSHTALLRQCASCLVRHSRLPTYILLGEVV